MPVFAANMDEVETSSAYFQYIIKWLRRSLQGLLTEVSTKQETHRKIVGRFDPSYTRYPSPQTATFRRKPKTTSFSPTSSIPAVFSA